jgi:hypothetical protein
MAVPQSEVALSARLFPRSYDPASALEVGPAVMFLTHLRQIVPEVFNLRPECGPGPSKLRAKRRRF